MQLLLQELYCKGKADCLMAGMQAMMLPVTPTAEQIQHCSGDSAVLWQRLGISLLATLVTLKVSALAAGSLTFPLWFPSLQATLRNRNVRAKFR